MKDSEKTQPLFDKAVVEINHCLETGAVDDPDYMDVALKAFLGHIKIRNLEVRESILRFAVGRELSENVAGLKQTLKKSLPEYVAK